MTIKHKDIIQAYIDGETIEVFLPSDKQWVTLNTNHCVIFHDAYQYRVAIKPKVRYFAWVPCKDQWVDVTDDANREDYLTLIKTITTNRVSPDSVTVIQDASSLM